MKKLLLILCLVLFLLPSVIKSQPLYYPPTSSTATWETIDPSSLGWCQTRIDNLFTFLEQQNTKGFIVLKDGKIVLEQYFGTFTNQSLWYWASAGKTITAFLVGKAQEENFLTLNDNTSTYLGQGWTSCTPTQENVIKIRNQLTMTSGLNDGVIDNHCTLSSCLEYLAIPGTRWAYHNAPYTLLEAVIQNATGQPINTYTQLKLKNPTGMTGSWVTVDFDNVYFSNVRSMARFGLLIQGNGTWNGNQLINSSYLNEMVNTSQNLNKSYGYLWWLNGKQSYMLPTTQIVFPGSYAPNAPSDMISGLGRDGQIVSISQSRGLVFIRMGEAPSSESSDVPTIFCNQIWQKINELDCTLEINDQELNKIVIEPNPATNTISISNIESEKYSVEIFDMIGSSILKVSNQSTLDISFLASGIYLVNVQRGNQSQTQKLIKR
ncbi:MAG: T9SS C-terminal target domain-containing protein [Flavobacteriaceae bacterium]|nr:T9SS C-terminal target domain-containing protein [Flavobacteriaceae bacterium]